MSGVLGTSRVILKGHMAPTQAVRQRKNKVWAVAFFKDGQRVVTGSHDKTLRILDVRQTGEMVGGPFKGHTDRVRSVAISPDDRRIASGGDDATVIIWDTESKQMVLNPLVKHTEKVNSVCFSPDGKRVASGSHDSTVVVWDAETGAVLATLDSQHRRKTVHVWSVSFSPDGLKLASGSSDHTVRVWCTVNAECLLKINAGQWSVRSVVWSPDGNQLVSGSSDNTAKFWNSSNGEKIGQPCIGHTRWITSLAISSGNSFIATASDDSTVRLWCTRTHKQIGYALEHAKKVHSVAISPDAELLVSGADDGNLQLWSVRDILEQGIVVESQTDDEESQGEQFHSCSSGTQDSSINSPDTHDAYGNDGQNSLFDTFAIKTTVRNSGDLHTIEDLLTHEIDFDEDDNRRDTYANRSIVRARKSEWDDALQDAVKSIAIQPSLLGYISKGIALCGKKQLWDAMEAFDFAFVFSNSDPNIINLLLLIKAIALFNAGRHVEAVRRVQDLTTAASQHSDSIPCGVVNSYLRVQLAISAFQDGRYSEAADQLDRSVHSITNLFSSRALFESRLKIFTVLFGWDLDSSWQTVNQIRCEACLCADRVSEAVESYQHMISMIDDEEDSDIEWSIAFKKDCTARCIAKGDEAVAAKKYESAIELYSAGIELDSSCESLFVQRSKANLERNLFAAALHDANRVIKLNPSSYLGYQLKNAALHSAVRCNEVEEAFEIMFSKLDDAPDTQIRQLQHCASMPDIDDGIRRVIHAQLESIPLRLLIPDPPPLSVFVDASTSFGIGFLADSRWLAWELLDGWRANGRDIGWAEMVAIDLGLRALVRSGLRDVHVRFHSDNQGGVRALKAGRSRNVVQNDILQRLSSFALEHGIIISVEWVRSCDNLADGISRGIFPPSRSRFSSPPPLPAYLKPFVRLV